MLYIKPGWQYGYGCHTQTVFSDAINLNNVFKGKRLFLSRTRFMQILSSAGAMLLFYSNPLLLTVRPGTKGRLYACLPFALKQASIAHSKKLIMGSHHSGKRSCRLYG